MPKPKRAGAPKGNKNNATGKGLDKARAARALPEGHSTHHYRVSAETKVLDWFGAMDARSRGAMLLWLYNKEHGLPHARWGAEADEKLENVAVIGI